jgi:hypothetical protein
MKKIEKWYNIEEVMSKREELKENYDNYTDYIEDCRQMEEARKNNAKICENIRKIDKVIDEMMEIFVKLNGKNEEYVEVTYAKGIIRVEKQGKMYYKRARV